MQTIIKSAISLYFCLHLFTIQAQSSDATIPLTNPSKPGVLEVNLITGSITVASYNGSDVIIQMDNKDMKKRLPISKKGLKKIGGGGYGLEAQERNNTVSVSMDNPNADIDLVIKVPKNFSLHLASINDGDIFVENVNGNHEISNVNGDIKLLNINGSVVANTINGDIIVDLLSVSSDTPMAFTNLNGDIEIKLPGSIKANIEAKSDNGEVYSDFDIKIINNNKKSNATKVNGYYKISRDGTVYGTINGGGPDITLSSMNGDILIKKIQ
jgi:Putative adhesin